ncbi:MAG TPA: MFS transporter [Candidatus Xenobia bacterium]|nr:MFS transporter [Candidatus Xenobia bacterium]
MTLSRDLLLILLAAFLRSAGIGLTGVLLALYLAQAGLSGGKIGVVVAVGLAGSAAATLLVALAAERLGRRTTLLLLAMLSVAGGVALVLASEFTAFLLAAFFGMLNGMGRDRGGAVALEQAMVPETVPAERRTWALAWYNLLLDAGGALGGLAGSLPYFLRQGYGLDVLESYRWTFGFYTVLMLAGAVFYFGLTERVETHAAAAAPAPVSPAAKRIVYRLAAIFTLDSIGGGFLTNTLLAYWFFKRFGVGEEWLGPLFFAAGLANAGGHLAAAWIAGHIGLVNTMVFTHIPASVLLIAVAFVPSFGWAAVLFLMRELLARMDVPTRQSYTLALVAPAERTFASGVTNLTRNISWAAAPPFAGWLMQSAATLSAPLFLGSGLKIVYDLLLFFSFRHLPAPEERRDIG